MSVRHANEETLNTLNSFRGPVPGTPTIGTATRTNDTTVSLTFTAAASAYPITGYKVKSTPDISLTVSGSSSPLTITGDFAAGVAYTFQVAASSNFGDSAYTAASNSLTVSTTATPLIETLSYSGYERTGSITADSSGNFYTTGFSSRGSGTNIEDTMIVKQASNGTITWQKYISFAQYDDSRTVVVDSSGNVYFGGFPGTVVKVNSSGVGSWANTIVAGAYYATYDIKVDSSGNVYACGYATNANSVRDMTVVKFNSSGTVLWSASIGATTGTGANYIEGVTVLVDSSSNVYAIGSGDSKGALIAKYNSSGVIQSQTTIDTAIGGAYEAAFNPAQTVIYLAGAAGIAAYNISGSISWAKNLSPSTNMNSVDTDSSGNVYAAGIRTVGSYTQIYVVKLNSSGTVLWERLLSHNQNSNLTGPKIRVFNNAIYLSVGEYLPAANDDWLIAVLPTDGSKIGTYTVGSVQFTWAVTSSTWSSVSSSASTSTYSTSPLTLTISATSSTTTDSAFTKSQANL